MEGEPRADPGVAEGLTVGSWNHLGFPRKSWRTRLGCMGYGAKPAATMSRTWISRRKWIDGFDACFCHDYLVPIEFNCNCCESKLTTAAVF